MAGIRVRENVTPALAKLDRWLNKVDRIIFKIAAQVRNRILKRTKSGLDVSGSPFTKYNDDYAAYKASKHRSVAKVTLQFFGHMLNSMSLAKIPKGAKIYFNDKAEEMKAEAHNFGLGRFPERNFFDLAGADEQYVIDQLNLSLNISGVVTV